MAGIYKVTSPREVYDVEPGGTLTRDLSAEEESDLVASHRVEIAPREFMVVGGSNVFDTAPGKSFTAALTVAQTAALIEGGHVEYVQTKKAAEKPAANKEKK